MKLWLKTVICITLVFIITVSSIFSGIIQVRKAEASFVPFIVENAEWLLAILAGFGISFATQSDAMAGVHDFAYKLDESAYNGLQNYIEEQKIKNATKLYFADLMTNGLITNIYEYIENLPIRIAAASGSLLVEYLSREYINGTIENNFMEVSINPLVTPFSLDVYIKPLDEINLPYVVINRTYDNLNLASIGVNKRWYLNKVASIYANDSGGYYNITIDRRTSNTINYKLNGNVISYSGVDNNEFIKINLDALVELPNIEESISHWLERDNGISIDENIGSQPLPAPGVSSPWDNKVIVPPSSVSEGVNLSPQDVLQQPAIDNFNNPVLDEVGNPVYQPVPQTWPNTQNPAYPPWPLSPDIGGVAEGTGVIGGILENIRDWVGDIGTFLTTDLPRILTTDIPLALENIFNGPPPGEEDNNDVTDKMNDFKLPDLFLLFLGVILACIRLMIRFITFLASLLLRGPDSSIIPDGMKQSLNFLKNWNIGLPISFYTLFSSLMTFFFGLRMIKYIKIFVANVHGGITQTYDPREFNDNEVYNEWSKSGHKTEYGDYRKVYDTWKESNSTIPWKSYLKQEAKRRKW